MAKAKIELTLKPPRNTMQKFCTWLRVMDTRCIIHLHIAQVELWPSRIVFCTAARTSCGSGTTFKSNSRALGDPEFWNITQEPHNKRLPTPQYEIPTPAWEAAVFWKSGITGAFSRDGRRKSLSSPLSHHARVPKSYNKVLDVPLGPKASAIACQTAMGTQAVSLGLVWASAGLNVGA